MKNKYKVRRFNGGIISERLGVMGGRVNGGMGLRSGDDWMKGWLEKLMEG